MPTDNRLACASTTGNDKPGKKTRRNMLGFGFESEVHSACRRADSQFC